MDEVGEAFLTKGRSRLAFNFSRLLFFLFWFLCLLFRLGLIFAGLPDIFWLLVIFLGGVVFEVAV